MPPAAIIGGGMLLGGGLSYLGSRKAAKGAQQAAATSAGAQERGAQISAQSQREALQYLKQREAVPQQFREAGLKRLGGLYGMPGGVGSQQELIERAKESPLYGAMMGGREAGEEAILRGASATGGLRSGNVQGAMYDYNTQLQNQALLQSYNQQLQGLQGMAGLPSNAPQIASGMAGVGQTLGQGVSGAGQTMAQGQVASGQAWQQGLQGISDIIGAGVGQYLKI